MRLDNEQESQNVEDRRGFRVSKGVAGGGIGTIAIILIALFLGALLLLQSLGAEQEMAVLSWTEVGHFSLGFASLRRPGLPAMLS